ncbi:MAG: Lrp/AsnC ligand binding domain-containing protein [Mycobacteriaceae bacterium]
MVQAFVLIQTEVGRATAIAHDISQISGVSTAQAVTGPYDIIVQAGAESLDTLTTQVVTAIQSISGITRTLTCPVASPVSTKS